VVPLSASPPPAQEGGETCRHSPSVSSGGGVFFSLATSGSGGGGVETPKEVVGVSSRRIRVRHDACCAASFPQGAESTRSRRTYAVGLVERLPHYLGRVG